MRVVNRMLRGTVGIGGMIKLFLCASLGINALAQGSSTLVFVSPPAQSSGNAIVSDPTIRFFQAPGVPASFGNTLPIDLLGNGRPDLVACYGVGPPNPPALAPCRVLRPQADGSVTEISRQVLDSGTLIMQDDTREIVIGDFNGDGRLDVFFATFGYDYSPFPGAVNVLLDSNQNGTYSDRSATLPQTAATAHSACVGDINGDGIPDIYVGNLSSVAPYFLIGQGDGTFLQKTTGLPLAIRNFQERYLSCTLTDVDQDGYADLVLGAYDADHTNTIILFNDGTGDFTVRPRYTLPPHPFSGPNLVVLDIVEVDINRDGRPDLVLLANQAYTGTGLQILINRGDGTFADETAARLGPSAISPGGSYCSFLRVADFNGDGWPDFYCNDGPQNVANRYWISNADGTWSPLAAGVLSPGSNFGIHAVDFDGDGRPDLLQIEHTGEGDIAYKSFLNRTPRTVPSEPLIGSAVAGNAQAAIFFSPPLSRSTVPVTGYTAACRQGTLPATISASGANSPITVPGLTNGKFYLCSVTAISGAGSSLPSRDVRVTPSALAPLTIVAVKSRKRHGVAGIFDISIDQEIASNGLVSVEPRNIGNGHSVVFQFNSAVNTFAPIAVVDEATTTLPAIPSSADHELVVTLPQLPDNKRVTISLPTINGISLNKSVTLGFLVGDVTGSRLVSAADISAVKANMNKTVDSETCRFDVSLSGSINSSDLSMVKARAGQVLP